MAASSSAVSSKSKTSKFSAIRDGRDRLRDRLASLLEVPAQHHLRRRLAVRRRDRADGRVLEGAPVLARAVERDAADRRPGLVQDAVLVVDGEYLGLPEVGVHLDLVHRGHDRGLVEQPVEVLGHEVADADGAHLAVGQQRLERAVGGEVRSKRLRQRLVQDEQVDLLDPQLAGALVEGVQGRVVAVVADPHLRLDEHVVRPVQARSASMRLPDLALVAVGRGGVDVAVARLERDLDRALK